MEKEEYQFQKRIQELAELAEQRSCVTFTDFLNLNELNMFYNMTSSLSHMTYRLFGGYDYSERQIVAFIPDALYYEWKYPLITLKISPLNKKFADVLTHRDYLGAILNLGVERGKIGDIIIAGQEAYFFCMDNLQDFFEKELTKVKHTIVCVSETTDDFHYSPSFVEMKGSIASGRLDNVIAFAYHTARNKMIEVIAGKKVFVNSKLVLSNSYPLKENDIVSVRGYGKFIYRGIQSETKKGRFYVRIEMYD